MISSDKFLPYGRQDIDDEDIVAVTEVLRSDFLTTGPKVAEFETMVAEAVDAPYAIACGNGTQALHLATAALGFGPGDWVIVPSVTFLATANAVRYVGADVAFADVDSQTGLMSVEHALEAAARAPGPIKAIMPVHLGGLPSFPEEIGDLARQNGWRVIEDGAHAIGTSYLNRDGILERIGACRQADACTLSFHPVKTVTTGEGGIVTTRDPSLAEKMRRLRSHGMVHDGAQLQQLDLAFDNKGARNPWYYEMPELGFNYRLPDILCALGISQMRRLNAFITRRADLVRLYTEQLEPLAEIISPILAPDGCKPGWHLFRVRINFERLGIQRARVMAELKAQGIGTQVHYIPVSLQPYYTQLYGRIDLPGAQEYYNQVLSLPLYPGMADDDVRRTIDVLRDILHV